MNKKEYNHIFQIYWCLKQNEEKSSDKMIITHLNILLRVSCSIDKVVILFWNIPKQR